MTSQEIVPSTGRGALGELSSVRGESSKIGECGEADGDCDEREVNFTRRKGAPLLTEELDGLTEAIEDSEMGEGSESGSGEAEEEGDAPHLVLAIVEPGFLLEGEGQRSRHEQRRRRLTQGKYMPTTPVTAEKAMYLVATSGLQ